MLRARLALVLAFAAQAGACTEAPSFQVRWKLHAYTELPVDAKDTAPLTSVAQCTEFGVSKIRMTTRRCGASCTESVPEVVDEREFNCFPAGFEDPGAHAPGPEAGPGLYTVTLAALGRRGTNFCAIPTDTDGEVDDPDAGCDVIASAAREVTIRETGEGQRIDDMVIVAVPQCDDGVDNDLDGATDLADPSCRGTRGGSEFGDVSAAQLTVRARLLGDNPNATCSGLGLRDLKLALAGPTPLERVFSCTTTAQTISSDLMPGKYTVSVTGLGLNGAELAAAELAPEVSAFELFASDFRALDIAAEFDIASFHDPIVAGFSVSLEVVPQDGAIAVTSCNPSGNLALDRVRLTVLDQDMQPIPTATLADPNGAIPLDGSQTIPCADFLKIRTVDPLTWDDAPMTYRALYVSAEMLPVGGDTPCFGNADAPTPAAPNASFPITLPRLSDQGACAD